MNEKESMLSAQTVRNSAQENEIILYQPDSTVRLEVRVDDDTVWLTQQQIADLFGTKRPAITKHLANIYKSGELEEKSTCSILEHMGNDGAQRYTTKYYNLDAILSVGYRVNSRNATLFRQWANKVLKEHLLGGYTVNQRLTYMENRIDHRLSEHDFQIKELRNRMDFFVRTSLPPKEGLIDRFLIIDDTIYHVGASFKDLGKKLTAFSRMDLMSVEELVAYLEG